MMAETYADKINSTGYFSRLMYKIGKPFRIALYTPALRRKIDYDSMYDRVNELFKNSCKDYHNGNIRGIFKTLDERSLKFARILTIAIPCKLERAKIKKIMEKINEEPNYLTNLSADLYLELVRKGRTDLYKHAYASARKIGSEF